MSIASEITSIGENLKKDYQSIANLGADLTNVDKNIENIAELLDGVYDNLPKTEYQEGTEITLSNTLKGKLDFENGVVGIGQSSQESTQGYNLISLKDGTYIGNSGVTIKVENGKCTLNGTPSASEVIPVQLKDSYSLTNGQTYTLYGFNDVANSNVAFRPRIDEGFFQIAFDTTNKVESKTYNGTSISVAYIGIRVGSGTTITNLVCKPMLISGSDTTKTYEQYTGGQASPNPSYPQTIQSVTGNQDVVVSGKNLLKVTAESITKSGITYTVNGNTVNINGTATAGNALTLSNTLSLNKGTYTLALNKNKAMNSNDYYIAIRKNNVDVIGGVLNFYNNTKTFTLEQDYIGLNIFIWVGNNVTLDDFTINIQLEQGSTATPYEPYITPTSYQLSLGDIELNAIGNYKDELIYDVDEDKVYKNEAIGKVVLNGTETWTKGETEQYRRFSTSNISTLKQTTGRIECLSNYFKYDYSATGHNVGTIFTYWTENGSIFVYPETTITTAEQLKTWLSTHNTIVYFILETPTKTEITGTLKDQIKALYYSHSNNGTTIITSNGNSPMIIKVRGLKGE